MREILATRQVHCQESDGFRDCMFSATAKLYQDPLIWKVHIIGDYIETRDFELTTEDDARILGSIEARRQEWKDEILARRAKITETAGRLYPQGS